MSKTAIQRTFRVPVLAILITTLTISPFGSTLLAQQENAVLVGTFVEKGTLQPADGIQAVVLDISTNTRYVSDPSDASGTWSVEVPPGGRFQIVGMVKDGGPEQKVLNSPIRAVRVPGTYEFAPVVFEEVVAPTPTPSPKPAAAPPVTAPAPTPAPTPTPKPPKEKGDKPGWKKPGAIVGYVLGGAALIAIAADSGSSSTSTPPVSPMVPE